MFKTKFTNIGLLFVFLLSVSFLGFIERGLYDIARLYIGGDLSYIHNPQIIFMHAIFAVFLLIIAFIIAHATLRRTDEETPVIVVPYYIVSGIVLLQVGIEFVFFLFTYKTIVGVYVCLVAFIVFCIYNLYHFESKNSVVFSKLKKLFSFSPKNLISSDEELKEETIEKTSTSYRFTYIFKNIFFAFYLIACVLVLSFLLYITFRFW